MNELEYQPHPSLGTSLVGYVSTTIDDLIDTFDLPQYGSLTDQPYDKIQAGWSFITRSGVIFTIYDYKETAPLQMIKDWHIGGNSRQALDVMRELGFTQVTPSISFG